MDWRKAFGRAIRAGLVCMLWPEAPSLAQIATDGTVGPAGPLGGPDYAIGDELGTRVGDNLFHSFKEFNLRFDESATFTGPADLANVISRVTGTNPSRIDGLLRSTVGQADFWFINPKGVAFGPNARLDVPASFHISTANQVDFSDRNVFSARDPDGSTLTYARPEAFGFLDATPNPIRVSGSLEVAPGKTLSLSAGSVNLFGSGPDAVLLVNGGEIHIATVAEPGVVVPGEAPAGRGGRVFAGDAKVDAGAGGTITLQAGTVSLDRTFLRANNGDDASVPPGRLLVASDTVELTRGARIESVATGRADAGHITVNAGELDLSGGSEIRTSTNGEGAAGRIDVSAGTLRIEGVGRVADDASLTGISSTSEDNPAKDSEGAAGSVDVTADRIELSQGGTIRAVTFSAGAAGSVDVHARTIQLQSGGQIGSGTLGSSTGRGGDVVVVADEDVKIIGELPEMDPVEQVAPPSSIFASSESKADGDEQATAAGIVRVVAPRIEVRDRGEIASETRNAGAGGDVRVEAPERLVVDDGEITTRTESGGDAGTVAVSSPRILIKNDGLISSASVNQADGNAGMVRVDAGDAGSLQIVSGGSVSASAASGGAPGEVDVTAKHILISGGPGMKSGTGIESLTKQVSGGTISIDADTIIVEQGAQITSDTSDLGHPGPLDIRATELIVRSGGEIKSSTTAAGTAGVVVIHAGTIAIEGVGSDQLLTGISSSAEEDSTGFAGSVQVTAGDLIVRKGGVVRSATTVNARRGAGNVVVEADRIWVLSGGEISSPTLGVSEGAGGKIEVTAHQRLEIRGRLRRATTTEIPPSNITASTESNAPKAGPGGDLIVRSPVIVLADGGEIASETKNAAKGGAVTVRANQLLIEGGEITATSTLPDGGGDAGSITVRSMRSSRGEALMRLTAGGKISTSAASAGGGSIFIQIDGLADLQRSEIKTAVANLADDADAGNVDLRPSILIADQHSVIDGSAFSGRGGVVTIGGVRIQAPGAVVDVSSVSGTAGQVVREGPDADLSSDLADLPGAFLVSERLFAQSCAERSGLPVSSLVSGGRGGLPADPGRPLVPVYLADRPIEAATDDNEGSVVGRTHDALGKEFAIVSAVTVPRDCS